MAKSKKKTPAKKKAAKPAKSARKAVVTKTKAKASPKPKPKLKPKPKVAPKTKAKSKAVKAPVKKAPPVKKTKAKPAPAKAKPAPKHVVKPAKPAKPVRPVRSVKPVKPAAAKPQETPPKEIVPKAKRSAISMEKTSKKTALRESILTRKAPTKPIAFSLDEVRAIAKTVSVTKAKKPEPAAKAKPAAMAKIAIETLKPAKPTHVQAASLADILGFNPHKPRAKAPTNEKPVPEKFKRYYKLLIDLRTHLTAGIELHSEETLKRSAKDDAGDLSSYGQHMADAGTDTFDRDFALSLVSSEQEALAEIEAAIKRIHDGTYGICEISGVPIAKERLLAVPFTRNSTEAQKNIERNRHRTRTQAGLFGEHGEEGGKIMDADSDD